MVPFTYRSPVNSGEGISFFFLLDLSFDNCVSEIVFGYQDCREVIRLRRLRLSLEASDRQYHYRCGKKKN